jgi:phosphatidylinositol 3-kinase
LQCFNILRKPAALIINMHVLMKDSHIPDFVTTGDRGIITILERFRLDMTDEEAVQQFQALMTDSTNALMPKIGEKIHEWATYWLR